MKNGWINDEYEGWMLDGWMIIMGKSIHPYYGG